MAIKRRNEEECGIKYRDMTPSVKSDIFVNDDFSGAVLTNLGMFVKSKNKDTLRERAMQRLGINPKQKTES